MAFRAVTGATVVGSTTAGADENISELQLPGGLCTMISGIGVFYPDKRPTQRIGIIPDVHASPTHGRHSGQAETKCSRLQSGPFSATACLRCKSKKSHKSRIATTEGQPGIKTGIRLPTPLHLGVRSAPMFQIVQAICSRCAPRP